MYYKTSIIINNYIKHCSNNICNNKSKKLALTTKTVTTTTWRSPVQAFILVYRFWSKNAWNRCEKLANAFGESRLNLVIWCLVDSIQAFIRVTNSDLRRVLSSFPCKGASQISFSIFFRYPRIFTLYLCILFLTLLLIFTLNFLIFSLRLLAYI